VGGRFFDDSASCRAGPATTYCFPAVNPQWEPVLHRAGRPERGAAFDRKLTFVHLGSYFEDRGDIFRFSALY
jgi:hypothetical protein